MSVQKSGIWLQILGLNAGMQSYTSGTAITTKLLRNLVGRCTSILANPKKQAFSTVFDRHSYTTGTLQTRTEQHIRLNAYLADLLPSEPSIASGQPEQTVAWPKHGDGASCSHRTFHHVASRALPSPEIYNRSRDHPDAHVLTNLIRHLSPGCEARCACGAE